MTATGARTHDEAAGVYVAQDATDGWDRFDASKLAPIAGPYATVGPVGPGPDGAPRALAQLSVAAGRAVTLPLAFTPDAATGGEEDAAAAGFTLGPVSPNLVAGAGRTVLEVREAQHVRAEVVDALGRRVVVLFDGALGAGGRQTLNIGGAALPAGTYVLRVTGAQFSATRTFSVAG